MSKYSKNYKCYLCEKSYPTRDKLQHHISRKHPASERRALREQRGASTELRVEGFNYYCTNTNCDSSIVGFETERGYKNHMRKAHPAVKLASTDLKCRHGCEHYFDSFNGRKYHEKKHHGKETQRVVPDRKECLIAPRPPHVPPPQQSSRIVSQPHYSPSAHQSTPVDPTSDHGRVSKWMSLISLQFAERAGLVSKHESRKRPRSPTGGRESHKRRKR